MGLLKILSGLIGAKEVTPSRPLPKKNYQAYQKPAKNIFKNFDITGIQVTSDYKRVMDEIENGTKMIFVSGRAGTGKTTLIDYIRGKLDSNIVVIAPTGVAALQAKGMTIHSFCKFPPHVITNDDIQHLRDRDLYKAIKLLIIDEISMVRCDLMDGIDRFMRTNGNFDEPFGGIQVIFVGDLFQLPPITVGEEDKALRLMGYNQSSGGHHFFYAKVFNKQKITMIELQKVFRQKNKEFSDLLNHLRVNEDIDNALEIINRNCYQPNKPKNKHMISLTTTNRKADSINFNELNKLKTYTRSYYGKASGAYDINKEGNLPSPSKLVLKNEALVMFTANDVPQKRWVNGTIGIVKFCGDDFVAVEVEGRKFEVTPYAWKSYSYVYDEASDSVKLNETGSYLQIPLMLSWAVTIHKGQGKTIENIEIDLGDKAFASGQTYVALSRCPTLEGIRLSRTINKEDVFVDPEIREFYLSNFSE